MQRPGNAQLKRTKKEVGTSEKYGRVGIIVGGIFLVGVFLIVRLYFIQVVSHDKWVAIAENQHNAFQELSADRGEIYIHDGEDRYPLAVNREYQMVYASPKDVVEKDRAALELARILGLDAGVIKNKLDRPNDPFEIIKKRLNDEEIARINELGLKGIAFLPEKYRYYPAGELASQVIGFASLRENGRVGGYGIESSKDGILRGETGTVSQEKDAAGRWLPLSDRLIVSPKNGESLLLTIDRVIQYETEKILKDSVERYEADSASAIVMDPKTGTVGGKHRGCPINCFRVPVQRHDLDVRCTVQKRRAMASSAKGSIEQPGPGAQGQHILDSCRSTGTWPA